MKPKVALIKDGKVPTKLGKGRMNAAQIQRCMELAAQGWDIDGYSVSKSVTPNSEPVVEKTKPTASGKVISDIPDQTRGEDLIPIVEGKRWVMGIRGICETCGNSLTYCYCTTPKVRVDGNRLAVVTFKPAPIGKR